MEMLIYNKYILKNPDRKKLKELGFHYNKRMSDSDVEFYSVKFPVLQYSGKTTVDGEIIIDMNSGEVRLNTYSYGTDSCYAPFYQKCNKVYEPIIEKINNAFNEMFNKIKIKKVGDK